ncbi:hypothetical protein ABT56_16190 [Photobacterium aquae]|uniref:Beta-lactamase-related domain-containing protein n=1 Tax=Photobacterium aquae TaxID=1195763 RepID=A0A0J1GWS7_9GAMM|nr:serine hydrolase domain-containing protein [Photobacterium aquae]KLV04145.1 hypothetical protein ABT56_16190 [Photobacterium aquae]
MIKLKRTTIAGLVALLASTTTPTWASDSLQTNLDDYFNHQRQYGWFNGNVLIAKDSNILYEESFGFADVKHKRELNPQNQFKVGSITKQFTAVAILKLYEEKKLDLNDPVSKYYPQLNKGRDITIKMLLDHTSGLYRDTDWREYKSSCRSNSIINEIVANSKVYTPSLMYNYSHANYYLLGGIIEKVTRQNYSDYVTKEIIRPAGLKDSSLKLTLSVQLAKSYELSGLIDAQITPVGCAGSAGELITTARDLYLWNQALSRGQIISHDTLQMMYEQKLGLTMQEIEGEFYYVNQGKIDGYKALLMQHPKTNTVYIAMSNVFNTNLEMLAADIVRIMKDKTPNHKLKLPKEDKNGWQHRIEVVGNYLDSNGIPLQIVFQDNVLQAKVNQFSIPLTIENKNRVVAHGIDNMIRIKRNQNEIAEEIIFFSRDGRYLSRFARITN